jgi:hypothetical protein
MKLKAALGLIVLVILVAGFLQMLQAVKEAPPLSPLVQSVRAGDVRAIEDLRDAGVDPNDVRGARGWTPLMHAVHKGQIEAARALLDAGADVNQRTGSGLTALMLAGAYGRLEFIDLLLERGADPRLRKDGLAALDYAMLGTKDVDRFTVMECQYEAVAALRRAAPDVEPRGARFERTLIWLKGCRF